MRSMSTPDYSKLILAQQAIQKIKQHLRNFDLNRIEVLSDGAQEVMYITNSSDQELSKLCALLQASGTFNEITKKAELLNFGCFENLVINGALTDVQPPKGYKYALLDTKTNAFVRNEDMKLVSFESYIEACAHVYKQYQKGEHKASSIRLSLYVR